MKSSIRLASQDKSTDNGKRGSFSLTLIPQWEHQLPHLPLALDPNKTVSLLDNPACFTQTGNREALLRITANNNHPDWQMHRKNINVWRGFCVNGIFEGCKELPNPPNVALIAAFSGDERAEECKGVASSNKASRQLWTFFIPSYLSQTTEVLLLMLLRFMRNGFTFKDKYAEEGWEVQI